MTVTLTDLEGRRIHGASSEILLSRGFLDFEKLIDILMRRGQKDGTFRTDFSDVALPSALLGAAEGLIRDRLMAQRAGRESPFSDSDVREIFVALIRGLAPA